jgi:hypothetical protein
MSDAKYYLLIGERTEGPYLLEELTQQWKSGRVKLTDLWATDGVEEWKQISELTPQMYAATVTHPHQPEPNHYPLLGAIVGVSLLVIAWGGLPRMNDWWTQRRVDKVARGAVLENLVAPATAKFAAEKSRYERWGGQHYVFLAVDSQNPFGAFIRNYFLVDVVEIDGSLTMQRVQKIDRPSGDSLRALSKNKPDH